jgi:hypothetical protein
MAMTTTNTAKTRAVEQRVTNLVANPPSDFPGNVTVGGNLTVQGVTTIGTSLTVQGAATIDANLSVLGSAGTSGSLHVGSSVLTDAQLGFLSGLSILPHQTTANSTAFNATAFAGLAGAVNILQGNLQGNGFES